MQLKKRIGRSARAGSRHLYGGIIMHKEPLNNRDEEHERVLRLRFATLRTNGERGVRVRNREFILDVSIVQRFHKWVVSLILLMLIQAVSVVHVNASVEIIAKCGELSGYIYDHANAKWDQDKIEGGSTIIVKEEDQYDIVFRDSTGNLQSAKKSGATIVPANGRENTMHIIAIYPGIVTEVYSFDKDLSLLTLHAERLFPFKTSKTMSAQCS